LFKKEKLIATCLQNGPSRKAKQKLAYIHLKVGCAKPEIWINIKSASERG